MFPCKLGTKYSCGWRERILKNRYNILMLNFFKMKKLAFFLLSTVLYFRVELQKVLEPMWKVKKHLICLLMWVPINIQKKGV